MSGRAVKTSFKFPSFQAVIVILGVLFISLIIYKHFANAGKPQVVVEDNTPHHQSGRGGCLDNEPGIVNTIHSEKVRDPKGALVWENIISFDVGDAIDTSRANNRVVCMTHGARLDTIVVSGDHMFFNTGTRIAGALPREFVK